MVEPLPTGLSIELILINVSIEYKYSKAPSRTLTKIVDQSFLRLTDGIK